MRLIIIGCGSMGKRRARCLRRMGHEDLWAYDPRPERREEIAAQSGVKPVSSAEEARACGADFALVCAPPHLHTGYLVECARAGIPLFCEAPCTLALDDLDRVIEASERAGSFIAPSCTYLHNGIHRRARAFVEEGRFGRLLAYLSHAGQHVADWHPYEDYRGFYASKRAQGGMCFDMLPHEFQMLEWFAGEVRSLSCMARRRSTTIETDADANDVFDVILDTAGEVSAVVHHDIFQRPPGVLRRLMFERGVVEFDWKRLRWAEYGGPNFTGEPDWKDEPLEDYDFERMYIDELAHAFRAWRGEETYLMPLRRERRVLELVLACERSSAEGVHLNG